MSKPRLNKIYKYDPVPLDLFIPPYGVQAGLLKKGDKVRVIKSKGIGQVKTIICQHVFVENMNKEFCGMIHINSLKKV